MKLWFWVKFAIAAFVLFGLADYYATSQTPELKACQAKYAATVDQLTTAAVAIDELAQRQAVINLAADAQHSYDLLVADPAHSTATVCAADRLAKMDAVIARLKAGGYLPDPDAAGVAMAKAAGEDLARDLDRFWDAFQGGRRKLGSASETETGQKRATSP